MRALFLVPRPGIRGPIPRIAATLVAALRSLGCEVTAEFWGRRSDCESSLQRVTGRAVDIAKVRRALAQGRYDVMVVHTAHDLPAMARDLPLLLAVRRRAPPVALHLHGSQADWLAAPGHRLVKAATSQLVRLSDGILVLSSEEQRQWREFAPTAQVHVVRNPYAPAGDAPPSFGRVAFGVPAGVPLVLFVGRLVAAKGIFDLLEAQARVLAHAPCHLLVAGAGDGAAQVQAAVDRLGLAAHVTLAGYLQGEALRSAYRLADLFVLPTYHEGFPTVIAEAMDAGLPIVTTPLRGAADCLREGENALFVPPRNPPALAQALLRLLADAPLRARMGAANRAAVVQFSPERVACEYLEVLQQVVRAPRCGAR